MKLYQVNIEYQYGQNKMGGYVTYQDDLGNFARLNITEENVNDILEMIRGRLPSGLYTDPWTNYTKEAAVANGAIVGEG